LDEAILIENLRRGDQSAFREIVEATKDMVYNTALGILQNTEDAEDITQEVFVQAYESIDKFKGESKLSTWLYRITVTKSIDQIRKKKRKKRFGFLQSMFGNDDLVVHEPPDFNHPGVLLDKKEDATLLFKSVEKLPENQKTAFVLNKMEGLSYQEVSEVMDTTVSSVESLLHRAKTNLKKMLQEEYIKQ
jgi:RNA polymerase sigma factor (sigma-70 family)